MKMYIYGGGHRCKILLSLAERTRIEIAGIIDSDERKWGTKIGNVEIYSPKRLFEQKDFYICVSFYGELDYEPIWDELVEKYGIDKQKILSFHDVLLKMFENIEISQVDDEIKNKSWNHIFAFAWKFNLGGVETWAKDTVDVLTCDDKNMVVLSDKAQFAEDTKCKIIDYFLEKPCEFKKNHIMEAINIIMNQLPCTIVCSRDDEVTIAATLIKRKYPDLIRIIMVVHGACDGMIRDMYSYDKYVDYYACVSTATKEHLMKLGTEDDKCIIIPPVITNYLHCSKTYTIDNEEPLRLGYVGRLEVFHKRADLLIELIKDLEKLELNYNFEIAGKGTYVSTLLDFIRDNNLGSKVFYRGLIEHDDIMDFWHDKDISLNVSDSEGRPISNLEAMICGVIPVVTATEGILEDVEDGVTGYLIKIGDHMTMAKKIAEIDRNRHILNELGSNAQKIIKEKVSSKQYVGAWLKILDETDEQKKQSCNNNSNI